LAAIERSKNDEMRVAILEAGAPPDELKARYCDYPAMFRALLAGEGRAFQAYDVTKGEFPAPADFDALIVTGSPAGAYDPLPWIGPLKDFLRATKGKPMVGVCFGHQIMAEAFGGRVEKSAKGFAVGLHHYTVLEREPWMDSAVAFAIPASHQDQVVVQPPNTRVIAASDWTPFAALAYTDQPAISFQGHPEFDPEFAEALIEARRGTRFDEAKADAGVASLHAPNDRMAVGRWIMRFLDQQGR
jgi:GMP synthase-like glutamine amidotransferase